MTDSPHHRTNRAFWNRTSDAYRQLHDEALAWGVWRIPEAGS